MEFSSALRRVFSSLMRPTALLKPFMKLSSRYFGDFERYTKGQAASVLDYKLYNGEYWIKTAIIKDNKKIVGWTKDYCPSVYDACN